MIKPLGLSLLLLVSFSALAEECQSGPKGLSQFLDERTVNFNLEPDGNFDLQISLNFPPSMSATEALKDFTTPEKIISSSNVLKEVTYPEGSKVQRMMASTEQEVVASKSCKSMVCAITQSKCHIPVASSKEASYHCSPDLTHEKTKELFYSGDTKYNCQKTRMKTSCTFSIKGRAKPYSKFFISRSSQQLAIGGALETAIGILKIAQPLAQDKAHVQRTLQSVSEDFYPRLTKSLQSMPSKSLSVSY